MGGLAFITQLLSMTLGGVFAEVNLYVFMLGLGLIGGIVEMVSGIMSMYSYDKAYQLSIADDSSATEVAYGASLMDAI